MASRAERNYPRTAPLYRYSLKKQGYGCSASKYIYTFENLGDQLQQEKKQ